ncbi:hypothetical protein I553_3804 [Mycobacterium xenopi 4042]|uniref:Uncharacterized protein n=1 Tax=Mycobacterium xenopi 4042 TaxID=1299334 RepID=X8EYS5_MYCXE|nr:hypothetical protein I553_3804 [Mycobacterium xenopi 4042]
MPGRTANELAATQVHAYLTWPLRCRRRNSFQRCHVRRASGTPAAYRLVADLDEHLQSHGAQAR